MQVIRIASADAPECALYTKLTESQLRNRLEPEKGVFIAESVKVIRTALQCGYEPVSFLMEEKHVTGDAAELLARCGDVPVYTGSREVLASLTGYALTRGVLCAMRRPAARAPEEVLRDAKRIAVLEGVVDSVNVGAIFRSAAALGIDGVLLTQSCCDPYNRRAVRVSMGTVFQVPWSMPEGELSRPEKLVGLLKEAGFLTAALALTKDAVSIESPRLRGAEKLALFLGAEGDGLSRGILAACDVTAIIPMYHGVDSLNVAAASAVAFWELRPGREPEAPGNEKAKTREAR